MNQRLARARRTGFTLMEMLVVVLIIGVLASIAVPQYFKVVEKGNVAEAMQYLNALKGAQERVLARTNVYVTAGAPAAPPFDVDPGNMAKFTAGALSAGTGGGWQITLTRRGTCPSFYGCYGITYDSGAAAPVTCTGGANPAACQSDLMSQ